MRELLAILDTHLGEEWAKAGIALRSQGVCARWEHDLTSVDQDNDQPNHNYASAGPALQQANPVEESQTFHTHYESAQRHQQYYAAALSTQDAVFAFDPTVDDDERAASRLCAVLPAGATVVDFGCNTARNLARLSARATTLLGVDLSGDSVAAGRERLAGLAHAGVKFDLRLGSITKPLPDEWAGACAGAVFTAVMQHLASADVDAVLRNMSKALAAGGHAWVSWKELPSRAELAAMPGLPTGWDYGAFTADQALEDARTQVDGDTPEAANMQAALQRRIDGDAAPVRAVMLDVDYVGERATSGGPRLSDDTIRHLAAQVHGPHNRPFLFYSYEDVVVRAALCGLHVVHRRIYLDAKQPYAAYHNDVILRKATE